MSADGYRFMSGSPIAFVHVLSLAYFHASTLTVVHNDAIPTPGSAALFQMLRLGWLESDVLTLPGWFHVWET